MITTILIIPNDSVEAESQGENEDIGLDFDYIYNVTENLSKIIFSYPPGDLAKGRAFGSEGEHWAANYLVDEMDNLILHDPTENQEKPYRDEIEQNKPPRIFRRENPWIPKLTSKIKRNYLELNVNDTDITDFYITPAWGQKSTVLRTRFFMFPFYCMHRLTNNYSYTDLDVIHKPHCSSTSLDEFFDYIEDKYSNLLSYLGILIPIIILEFQEYYDFSFEELNETNAPDLLSEFYYNISSEEMINAENPYVLIEENPTFDLESTTPLRTHEREIINYLFLWKTHRKCKGIIRFDDNSNVEADVFDNSLKLLRCLPTIFINRSLGTRMYEDPEDHKVNFTFDQKWTNEVESYNVIGQINGTDSSKTVVIGCLYDSWWNQGTADSAIGIGIMMSIAKYMKELENEGIQPKYNVKFIAFSGEEYRGRGAYSYEIENRKDENIVAMIDLNQLGFKQSIPKLIFNIVASDEDERILAKNIFEKTNFLSKMSNNISEFKTWTTRGKNEWNYFGDYVPFDDAQRLLFNRRDPIKILSFLKSRTDDDGEYKFAWGLHHRDGQGHTEGDSMEYYDPYEIKLTAEMIWNFTKFYTIDPDCEFSDFSYDLVDTDSDPGTDPDTVNISFSIQSRLPNDRVMVRAILWSQSRPFCRYMNESNYTITSSGVEDNLTISLPECAPSGKYTLWVFLYNSTGEIHNDLFPLTGLYDIGYYKNDSREIENLDMGSANSNPYFSSEPSANKNINVKAGIQYFYTASATDPEGNQMFYQWDFEDNQMGHEYTSSAGMYTSGVNQTVGHTWTSKGTKQVRVRAIDEWYGSDGWSNWSEPLNVHVNPGCSINVGSTTVLVNKEQIDFTGIEYDFDFGERGPNWNWNFGNGNTSTEQNTSQTYNTTGEYPVNLTLEGDSSNVSYEIIVKVVNLSADFSVNQNGAQPNETFYFTDLSDGINGINNWTWNFGDGNISYDVNPEHNYSVDGDYNVTLTVMDGQDDSSNITKIVHIDSVLPMTLFSFYSPNPVSSVTTPPSIYSYAVGFCSDVIFYADLFDNRSGIDTVNISITNPDNISWNYTLATNSSHPYGYEFIFDNTSKAGQYNYTFWVKDEAGNINRSSQGNFMVSHLFGYPKPGNLNQSINDRITGSVFTTYEKGTADNVMAYIQTNLSTPPKTKCMIYRKNDSTLIGTTEEKTVNTGDDPEWMVYNFTGTKPSLECDTEYVLVCWSNDTSALYYDNCSDSGRYDSETHGTPPDPTIFGNEERLYSIYCCYSTKPRITNVSHTPAVVGFGFPVNISVNVTDNVSGIESVMLNFSFPNDGTYNVSMNNTGNDTFEYCFSGTWLVGNYNYSIRAVDRLGGVNCSSVYNFTVSANATISICTIKDVYGSNETINLTDPPGDGPSSPIGYELLENNSVLHIWNRCDSYYFNTSSGIQLTNHYDDYWSHNVLMLGYYNNDEWNLIYRTDELSGFNKNIESDNETFVNATLWKDLTYNGYDFRLAIRYYLGVDDNELTVIPYIKNLGQAIPYTLGFGWEMKNIQIKSTPEDDYIKVNGTSYYLNQTLDETYTNLSFPVYNATGNISGWTNPIFEIAENETTGSIKYLYLVWNKDLDYLLMVKNRTGQYNAPVILFVKVGTLAVDQEKYTMMYWYDSESTYYFNAYDSGGEEWVMNPANMVDGDEGKASTTGINGDVELCIGNTCDGTDLGTISKVEIRAKIRYILVGSGNHKVRLRPVFAGGDGDNHDTDTRPRLTWTAWFDITTDTNAPSPWSWSDVQNLDCDVESVLSGCYDAACSKVEIRVTHTSAPEISNPYPADGSSSISLTPTLNITVSDSDGDDMNITWSSNSSGSWQIFGTNNSVQNGTCHQTFANVTVNGQWWYWKVNVTDGTQYNESSVYKFYTGCQSKIKNTGNTDISGYLLFEVHYYNETSEEWEDDLYYEVPESRVINSGEELGLDVFFNGYLNTSALSFGNGTYRVYVAFMDNEGNILVTDDETELFATYEFTVTFE